MEITIQEVVRHDEKQRKIRFFDECFQGVLVWVLFYCFICTGHPKYMLKKCKPLDTNAFMEDILTSDIRGLIVEVLLHELYEMI